MDLETFSNVLCWIASSILLLMPLQRVVANRRSLYSLDVMVSSLVWIMYFPYLGGLALGLIELKQGHPETVTTAIWFALACSIAWSIGRLLTSTHSARGGLQVSATSDERGIAMASSMIRVFLVAGCVGFLLQMSALPNFVFSYQLSRTALLSQKNHVLWLIGSYLNLCLLIAVGIATVHRLQIPKLFRTALLVFGTTSFITFIQIRSRTFVIAGLFILLYVFATRSGRDKASASQSSHRFRGLRLSRMVVFAASIFLVAGVLQGARGAISVGLDEFWLYFQQLDLAAELERAFLQEDLAYSEWYIASLELFPEQHPFLYGTSYLTWPLQFIPRSIFPWKPEDTQILFCRVVRPAMAAQGGTIPPSIFGDAYINFGFAGFAAFAPFGMLLGTIDNYCTSSKTRDIRLGLLVAIISGTAPHFARGGFHNAMCLVVFVFGVNILLQTVLISLRRSPRRRVPPPQARLRRPSSFAAHPVASSSRLRRPAPKR